MASRRKAAKGVQPRAATRKRAAPVRRARSVTRNAATVRQRRVLEALRTQAGTLARNLRNARRELRQANLELLRLRGIESEAETLRREIGPQRPLLTVPAPAPSAGPEPWMPPVVEAHLTALHDHDVAALEPLLAGDVVVTEAAFPDATCRSRAEGLAFHRDLFATWREFRFMPRHWHNIGSVAFLEGDASFVHRGQRHGISANGTLVTLDMLFIYHLAEERIRRIKLYYDADSIRRQVMVPTEQGELF
jgi:ketosteroid isomerase-like protein